MRALSLWIILALSARAAEFGQISGVVRLTNQPASDAIVYLGAGSGRAMPTNAVLDVRGGVLQPRVQVATRGSMLVLRNSDPTLHIVRVETLRGTNAPVCVPTNSTFGFFGSSRMTFTQPGLGRLL